MTSKLSPTDDHIRTLVPFDQQANSEQIRNGNPRGEGRVLMGQPPHPKGRRTSAPHFGEFAVPVPIPTDVERLNLAW